jgi:prevent-host-death family protein
MTPPRVEFATSTGNRIQCTIMKVIEMSKATGTLAEYADEIQNGPVIVTNQGHPVAALVPIENADLETVALSTNPRFIELIERSRSRVRAEGGISSADMRKRFE